MARKLLYKYLKPEHVDGAVNEGKFRIGTLHEYQDAEKYPGAQLDRGEGEMDVDGFIHGYSAEAGHTPPPELVKIFGPGIGPGSKSTVNRTIIENYHDRSPNLYIFCTSHRFNHKIYTRPEYGAAVLITNRHKFIRAITKTLIDLGKVPEETFLGGAIRYRERRNNFLHLNGKRESDLKVPPFLIKPDDYADEYEWRFVWSIKSLQADLIVTCSDAAQYVEEFRPAIFGTAA